jgi:hypothetical protein
MKFSGILKEIRMEMGYKSARSFFLFMSEREELSFNYSYYTRIESSSILPSSDVVNNLSLFLEKANKGKLVKAYCREIFPNYGHLFEDSKGSSSTPSEGGSKEEPKRFLGNQKELSLKQIAIISNTPKHYFFFLTLTLSRRPLEEKECREILKEEFDDVVKNFVEAKLVKKSGERFESTAIEYVFPNAYNADLVKTYNNFDLWDKDFRSEVGLKEVKKKFFIRRTSPRYLGIIEGYLNHLDEFIRVSDETDTSKNDEVFVIDYVLCKGKLPG